MHTTQQVSDIKEYFTHMLVNEKFETIIEVGTSYGGLTYILDDIIKENYLESKIFTFDNGYKDYVEDSLNKRGCIYIIMDEKTSDFPDTIYNIIKNGGKTLILCDGGDKKYEFNLISDFLKKGDFLMAHDYCDSKIVFDNLIKNKIWNWFEISYEDIKDKITENNLEEYNVIDFQKAVWACYRKK